MIIFCGKVPKQFHFKNGRRNQGCDAKGKRKLRNYVEGHCAQGVLKLLINIAATVNSPEATGAYFY